MSLKAQGYLKIAAAVVLVLAVLSMIIEANWREPTIKITGLPASATLDEPFEFQVEVSYHNRFDVTSVGTRVIKPLVAKAILERPQADKKKLGFFSYSHLPLSRSRTYTVKTSLRDMLTSPGTQKKKLKVPDTVVFDLRVNGWMVRHSQNHLALFTGTVPDRMRTIQRDFEIEVRR